MPVGCALHGLKGPGRGGCFAPEADTGDGMNVLPNRSHSQMAQDTKLAIFCLYTGQMRQLHIWPPYPMGEGKKGISRANMKMLQLHIYLDGVSVNVI